MRADLVEFLWQRQRELGCPVPRAEVANFLKCSELVVFDRVRSMYIPDVCPFPVEWALGEDGTVQCYWAIQEKIHVL